MKKNLKKRLCKGMAFIACTLCGAAITINAVSLHNETKNVNALQAIEQVFEERKVDYFTTYSVGETIAIHNLKAGVNGVETSLWAELRKDAQCYATLEPDALQKNYVFTEKGKYQLVYFLKNTGGEKTVVKTFQITVNVQPYFAITFASRYVLNASVPVQALCKYFSDSMDAQVQITSPTGICYVTKADSVVLDECGIWEIKYSTEIGGNVFSRTYTLFVDGKAETYDEYITPISDISSIVADMEAPEFAKGAKGIGVLSSGTGGSFRFNNAVDFKSLEKDDNVFNVLPLNENEYSNFTSMSVKLVDAYDESNFLVFYLRQRGAYPYDQLYCTLEYKGIEYSCNEDGSIATNAYYGVPSQATFHTDWLKVCTERYELYKLYQQYAQYKDADPESDEYKKYEEYKAYSSYYSYANENYYGECDGFMVRYDSVEKQFFVWRHNHQATRLIVDLDDPMHVGYGNEWQGFTTAEAYVEVDFSLSGSGGGCIVLEMGGEDLYSGSEKTKAPTAFIETETDGFLPMALKGSYYKFPAVTYSLDIIDGKRWLPKYTVTKLEKELIKDFRYREEALQSHDGFTPSETGVYRITYNVEDSDGNLAIKMARIRVTEDFGEKGIELGIPSSLRVGDTFTIPEVNPNGMSYLVKRDVSIVYNGVEYAQRTGENVFLSDAGSVKIKGSFKDYLGEMLQYEQTIPVIATDEPIIEMTGLLPKYVIKGSTITLPNLEALNYAKQGTAAFETPWALTVDGAPVDTVTREVLINKNHGEKMTVTYAVEGVVPIIAEMTVVEARYLKDRFYTTEGLAMAHDTKQYTAITATSDANVDFINPFILDANTTEVPFVLDISSPEMNFSSIDVYMSDYFNPQQALFVRITKLSGVLYAQLNGEGARIAIAQNEKSQYTFSFEPQTRKFYFSIPILAKMTDGGETFEGFTSNRMNMSLKFNGVVKETSLQIYQLSILEFQSSFSNGQQLTYTDMLFPILVSQGTYLNNSFDYGSEAYIPAVEARTLLSGSRPAKITITSPSGRKLVDSGNGYNDYKIKLDEYGVYTLTYVVPFRNTTRKTNYTFRVFKEEPHEISFSEQLHDTYKLGMKLIIPDVAVTGAIGECTTQYVLINPNHAIQAVAAGDQIVLDIAGEYSLTVLVEDKHNIVTKTWYFKVN